MLKNCTYKFDLEIEYNGSNKDKRYWSIKNKKFIETSEKIHIETPVIIHLKKKSTLRDDD